MIPSPIVFVTSTLCLIIVALLFRPLYDEHRCWRGAVYEHVPLGNENFDSYDKILELNLDAYVKAAELAAANVSHLFEFEIELMRFFFVQERHSFGTTRR